MLRPGDLLHADAAAGDFSPFATPKPDGAERITCIFAGMSDVSAYRFSRSMGFDPDKVVIPSGVMQLVEALGFYRPRFVVVELGADKLSWLFALRRVRDLYKGPLVVLGDRDDSSDLVMALDLGADNFLSRTITPRVLLSHLWACERSIGMNWGSASEKGMAGSGGKFSMADLDGGERPQDESGQWVFDSILGQIVTPDGRSVKLTENERVIMLLLMKAAPDPVTRQQLNDAIRGRSRKATSRSMDVILCRLRTKLRAIGAAATIAGLRGMGYQLIRASANA